MIQLKSRWEKALPRNNCFKCGRFTKHNFVADYPDRIGEYKFVIENVPGYSCPNCKIQYFCAAAVKDAELQAVEYLEMLTKRKRQIIENWDILIPERRHFK